MKGQFHWHCTHRTGKWLVCGEENVVELDTRDPEPKALVCASCQTPAGAEALVRNNGA